MPRNLLGMPAVRAAFKALPDIAKDALNDATEETAERIRAGAVQRVPVRYGFLSRFIAMRMSRKSGIARVGVLSGNVTTPSGQVVSPSNYGHFSEFGTVNEEARPFMLPAAEEQRGPYLSRAKATGPKIERDMSAIGGGRL